MSEEIKPPSDPWTFRDFLFIAFIALAGFFAVQGVMGFYNGCAYANGAVYTGYGNVYEIKTPTKNRLNRVLFAYPKGYKFGDYMCRDLEKRP